MSRLFSGLLFFYLTVGGAFAGEAQVPAFNPPDKPSPADFKRHTRTGKAVSKAQPGAPSGSKSLPLAASSAYASEHAASLPMASPVRPASPSGYSWTGFYVGAGAGAARP